MPAKTQAQLWRYQPPPGRFTRISGYPATLASFWRPTLAQPLFGQFARGSIPFARGEEK